MFLSLTTGRVEKSEYIERSLRARYERRGSGLLVSETNLETAPTLPVDPKKGQTSCLAFCLNCLCVPAERDCIHPSTFRRSKASGGGDVLFVFTEVGVDRAELSQFCYAHTFKYKNFITLIILTIRIVYFSYRESSVLFCANNQEPRRHRVPERYTFLWRARVITITPEEKSVVVMRTISACAVMERSDSHFVVSFQRASHLIVVGWLKLFNVV